MPRLVDYRLQLPAAWITLDRPQKRNALSPEMIDQLAEALRRAEADDAVRAIVLTGSPPAFCAGADLGDPRRVADAESPAAEGRPTNPFARLLEDLLSSPKPVIAAVGGAAFGGGLGLIAASDIAIASREATFSFSEVRVGLVPAMISVVVVPKIGVHHARRLFATGRRFSAEEARSYGLLHEVVSPGELGAAVLEEVEQIARGGPGAVAEAKRLLRELPTWPRSEAWDRAAGLLSRLAHSEEGLEGMRAFAEKRPPEWRR